MKPADKLLGVPGGQSEKRLGRTPLWLSPPAVLVMLFLGLLVTVAGLPSKAHGSRPGGQIIIKVTGVPKGSPVEIRVRGPRMKNGRPLKRSLLRAGRKRMKGLPLGRYTVRAKVVRSSKGIARPKRSVQRFRLSKKKPRRSVKVAYGPPLVRTAFVAKSVSAGSDFSCAIQDNGQVYCWGDGCYGQLGDGSPTDGAWGACINYGSDYPIPVKNLQDAKLMSSGYSHSCAIRQSGQVVCWGVGYGNAPVQVRNLQDAKAISAGVFFTCAIRGSGQAVCWGDNFDGQLGNGESGNSAESSTPVEVLGLGDARRIAAGAYHSCAIRESGRVVCWGENDSGQLGNGDSGRGADSPVPVEVQGLTDAVEISVGHHHSCAIRESGQAVCWGSNWAGQLGDGSVAQVDRDENPISEIPVEVSNLGDAKSLSQGSGWAHTCALRETGQAVCWGNNEFGQLGIGTSGLRSSASVPVNVEGLSEATMISATDSHSCAIRSSGVTTCWGTPWGVGSNVISSPRDVFTFIQGS